MTQLFLGIGSAIFLILGAFHGILALRDVFTPRTFTPVDDSVQEAMIGVPIALHPKTDLWKAWLGFNLSHSLGLVVFGGALLSVAMFNPETYTSSAEVQFAAIAISAIYFILSIKFWFIAPVVGSGIATVCFIVAAVGV